MEDLKRQYFDPQHATSFSGARNLIRANKRNVSSAAIREWFTKHDTYTLHKAIRRKFPRLYYDVNARDQVWEADLIQLTSLKNYNDGISYILVVIDVLSKFVWVQPLHDKTTREVTNAFKKILDNNDHRFPGMVQSDKGKEFLGNTFQTFLKENDIQFRVVRNPDVKAAVVERFNRTLKERMYRYFSYKNTYRYIDVLQDLVKAYNKTPHSTIKMPPAAVTIYNAHVARKNLVATASRRQPHRKKAKYKTGQYVRISREKNVFEKGAEKKWSEEIFKIVRVLRRQKIFVYELVDLEGENIEGFFYPEELSLVHRERVDQQEYTIDKVLRSRGKGRKKEYFVSWVGYPDKFNSWIPAKDLRRL